MQFMRVREAEVYAVLRIVTGFLFLWHGMQKLFGFPVPMPPGVPAFVTWIAGPLELVGGSPRDDRALHQPGRIPAERAHGVRLLDGARLPRAAAHREPG